MVARYETRERTEYIAVHCSATSPDMDIGREEIRRWHVEDKRWIDIGYHFVIRRDGTIEMGRPLSAVGAHVRGYNYTSVGVCYVGGVNEENEPRDNRTTEQKLSLRLLVAGLLHEYPGATVCGHRDFTGVRKACPSFNVARWWQTSTKEE